MRPTIVPAPSPLGTNRESLFLVKLPRGTDPKGALDAALRKVSRDKAKARDEGPDLSELRAKLEHLLNQTVSEDCRGAFDDLFDEYLPRELEQREARGQTFGEVDDEDDPESLQRSLRAKLPDHSDDSLEDMPRNGNEVLGGRAIENDRRHADDRRRGRRGAMDSSAQSSFDRMFPDAARIGSTNSFR
jgi:hypothetical protein